jgi:Mg-chelatase subunit ChlD
MSFLAPWVAIGLAGIVVPTLVIFYFLKLRRREEPIASTLLWKKAVKDLEVNAPFQRLRKNLLLLLQLLVLAAALFALARPIVETTLAQEDSLIILIDRSASMNTVEESDTTRLDDAKDQAIGLVRALNQRSGSWFSLAGAQPTTRVMVIAFADHASVVAPFTTNTADLVNRIEAIEPSEASTNLGEALTLSEAYLAQTTVEFAPDVAREGSRLVLLTDGRVSDLKQAGLRYGQIEAITVGETHDNAGITAMRVSRNFERPEQVSVFVELRNFGDRAIVSDVALYLDGRLVAVREERIDGISEANEDDQDEGLAQTLRSEQGGKLTLSFELPTETGGVLEVRLARKDALAADNSAFAVVPPPRQLRVLLVTQESFLLDFVLSGQPLAEYRKVTPAQYEALPEEELVAEGRSRWDVIVMDRTSTGRLPVGNYVFLAGLPLIEGVSSSGTTKNSTFIWWDETHPILRRAALEYVFVSEALQFELPDQANILAEGTQGPLLAQLARDGRQYILLAFAVEKSNWWSRRSYPVFFYNLLRYLGAAGAVGEIEGVKPGETLAIPIGQDAAGLRLTRPDASEVPLKPNSVGMAYYGATDQVGIYSVVADEASDPQRFAVNLGDAVESNIRPLKIRQIGAQEVTQGQSIKTSTPEVWRWFVGASILILMLEWYIYNRRVAI